jgi:hypothetical protein
MSETLVQRLRREVPQRGDIGLQQAAATRIEQLERLLRSVADHPDTPELISGVILNELADKER